MKNRKIKRYWKDYVRHPWLHLFTVLTLVVSLTVIGAVFLLVRNLNHFADQQRPLRTGTAYLQSGLSVQDIEKIKTDVSRLSFVESVEFKSGPTVLRELNNFLNLAERNAIPNYESFPDILEFRLKSDLSDTALSDTHASVSTLKGVSEVDISVPWHKEYESFRTVFSWVSSAILIFVMLACSFIIANLIGMRLQTRKRDMEIASILGAEKKFLLAPIISESCLEGCVAALGATLILQTSKAMITALTRSEWISLFGGESTAVFLSPGQLVLLLILGIGMALLGSLATFLRFQQSNA